MDCRNHIEFVKDNHWIRNPNRYLPHHLLEQTSPGPGCRYQVLEKNVLCQCGQLFVSYDFMNHDFSITQILGEIYFGDSRSAKSAILTHSLALNFDFYEFLYFFKVEICQINKIQSPFNGKNGVCYKLISRKIWVTDKSWTFHTVTVKYKLYFS